MTWLCICENCGHNWVEELPEDDDPDTAGVTCDQCDSDLISGVCS